MRNFSYTDLFIRATPYLALTVALVAMLGSLYFSEVNGYVPCALCWYQRILMYPLVGILAIGLLRLDINLPYYILPFSILGQGIATYHYLLQKTNIFSSPTACLMGVPCSGVYINWLGFITIPFLAMSAFFLITIFSLIALTSGEPAVEDSPSAPWGAVLGIIVVVGGIFYYLFQTGATPASTLAMSELPGGDLTPVSTPVATPATADGTTDEASAATTTDVAHGEALYRTTCAACHGPEAQGVMGLGNNLVTSPILHEASEAEALAFIRAGVAANDPNNQTGVAMPPSGGRPDLTDTEMLDIIAYLRNLE